MSIVFVILHYIVEQLTCGCIDSILSIPAPDGFHISIVVIDNGSQNESGISISERYSDNNAVHVILSKDNLGFSRANNRAFEYARDNISADRIIVMNNDTVIRQQDFIEVLDKACKESIKPYVIGPDIFVERKGLHQNPIADRPKTEYEAKEKLARLQHFLQHEKSFSLRRTLSRTLSRTSFGLRILQRRRDLRRMRNTKWREQQKDVVLHGAALIFTEYFISTQELPFQPETFLYEEEEILANRCLFNGWHVLYEPALQVIHYDDGATDSVTDGWEQKNAFLKHHEINSMQVLIDYIQSD